MPIVLDKDGVVMPKIFAFAQKGKEREEDYGWRMFDDLPAEAVVV